MFNRPYFIDPRYRENRIRMVILLPIALLGLGGIGVLLVVQHGRDDSNAKDLLLLRDMTLEPVPGSVPPAAPAVASAGSRNNIEGAVLAFRSGDQEGARKILAGIDLEKTGSPFGWELAGLMREREGDKKAALDYYSRGIALMPSEGLYYRRALIHRESGEFESALGDMNRAMALAPADIVISNERILLLVQMGRKDQAGEELKALNVLGNEASGRIFALCGIALENGDFSQGGNLLALGKKAVAAQVFEQMLKNPVISRYQGRPEIMPFYISNMAR